MLEVYIFTSTRVDSELRAKCIDRVGGVGHVEALAISSWKSVGLVWVKKRRGGNENYWRATPTAPAVGLLHGSLGDAKKNTRTASSSTVDILSARHS